MHEPFKITLEDLENHDPANLATVFSIGNGHFGVRASDPAGRRNTGGTVVNGFAFMRPPRLRTESLLTGMRKITKQS